MFNQGLFSDSHITKHRSHNNNNTFNNDSFKKRIFTYYYNINKRKSMNIWIIAILLIIETTQMLSYAFTEPVIHNWPNASKETLNTIGKVIGAFRIIPLLTNISYELYLILWISVIVLVMLIFISYIAILQLSNTQSKVYMIHVVFSRYFLILLTTVLFIPLIEFILLMCGCHNGQIAFLHKSIQCFAKMHLLYFIISLFVIIIIISILITTELFLFYPFAYGQTIVKVSNKPETFTFVYKLILIFSNVFGINKTLIIIIYFIGAVILANLSFYESSYNSHTLDIVWNFKNFSLVWTGLILLFTELFNKKKIINAALYIEVLCYPLVVALSVFSTKIFRTIQIGSAVNYSSPEVYLQKILMFIRLSMGVVSESKRNNKSKTKNELLLKGFISLHEMDCSREECPLKTYLSNTDETVKQVSLLNYIDLMFREGITQFPTCQTILLHYIYFNYDNKFNIHSTKIMLTRLESLEKNIVEEYLLFILYQKIEKYNLKLNKTKEGSIGVEDNYEMKYRRLKILIEESTKLFSDFWGNLGTNLTSKINLSKIFFLGKKINIYLDEIHLLWEKDLKNKEIDYDNQSIVHLYGYFLRKILRNKEASEEIAKKLNEEHHYDYSKKTDETNIDIDSLDKILENPEIVLFARSNDKGECNMIQCSNSFVLFSGYQKHELIGKQIEYIMPRIFAEGQAHMKMLSQRIKLLKTKIVLSKKPVEKKQSNFIVIKTKSGFIYPCFMRFTFYAENDFSNTFLIKARFELKDSKNIYPNYILTKDDFTIDNITSSSLSLGLTHEMIKSNLIDLNLLIRNEKMEQINFIEEYQQFEEEPKNIHWVNPDKIYSLNNIHYANSFKKTKIINQIDDYQDEDIDNSHILGLASSTVNSIISNAPTKKYSLLITPFSYSPKEVVGYIFRLIEVKPNKMTNDRKFKELCDFSWDRHLSFLYDMHGFNYIRIRTTNYLHEHNKTQSDSLTPNCNDNNNNNKHTTTSNEVYNSHHAKSSTFSSSKLVKINRSDTKKKESPVINLIHNAHTKQFTRGESIDSEDVPRLLNKEVINQLQAENLRTIQDFIYDLPFYGKDISLEKFRPNKEKYVTGKSREPLIKISLSEFITRIEEKIKLQRGNMNNKKYRLKKKDDSNKNEYDTNTTSSNDGRVNYYYDTNNHLHNNTNTSNANNINDKNEIGDIKTILDKYINQKSSRNIQIFSFIMVLVNLLILSLEFGICFSFTTSTSNAITKTRLAYTFVSSVLYTHYFIIEAILAQDTAYPNINGTQSHMEYIYDMMNEMTEYRNNFISSYNAIENDISPEYKALKTYLSETSVYIRTISNSEFKNEVSTIRRAIERLTTNIFYVSTVNDNYQQITLDNRNAYELVSNLLNDYLIRGKELIELFMKNVYDQKKNYKYALIVLIGSFVIQITLFVVLYNLLKDFQEDKEKPLNLFLTIKKQKFEQLKEASELFLNQLLNKIFGNDDIEQETASEGSIDLKSSDIVITKLKNKNTNISSYQKFSAQNSNILLSFIKLIIFFMIIQIYLVCEYIFFTFSTNKLILHAEIANLTEYTHIKLIECNDISKSFLFKDDIPIYNETNTTKVYKDTIYTLTEVYGDLLARTYTENLFASYTDHFKNRMLSDISSFVTETVRNSLILAVRLKQGFKPLMMRYFDILRVIYLKWDLEKEGQQDKREYLYFNRFAEINIIVRDVIRPWFNSLIEQLFTEINNYVENVKLIEITLYLCFALILVFCYLIFWKNYERKLNESLKVSLQLLNLLPYEIKYQIAKNIEEEDNAKD